MIWKKFIYRVLAYSTRCAHTRRIIFCMEILFFQRRANLFTASITQNPIHFDNFLSDNILIFAHDGSVAPVRANRTLPYIAKILADLENFGPAEKILPSTEFCYESEKKSPLPTPFPPPPQ